MPRVVDMFLPFVLALLAGGVTAPALGVAPTADAPAAASTASTASAPLIARAALFGAPARRAARLSPDGHWLSWIAPQDGVDGAWVAPVEVPDGGRALTTARDGPVRATWWSPDSRSVLFVADDDPDLDLEGATGAHLVGVDIDTGEERAYTPAEGARVQVLATSARVKTRILLGIREGDARWPDVYRLDLASGALDRLFRNGGYDAFVADADLALRLARQTRDDGSVDWFRVHGVAVEDAPVVHASVEDALATTPLQFDAAGRTLWWRDARGGDTVDVVAESAVDGRRRVVAHDARADVDAASFDPASGVLQAVEVDALLPAWQAVGPTLVPDLDVIAAAAGGPFRIVSRSDDDQRWLVTVDRASQPPSTWLYERAQRRLAPLFVGRPALVGAPLLPMQPVEIRARDGLRLTAYLTRPAGPHRATPMVLLAHGGPWARDTYGFDAVHQWLANRGYAVLSVNFRGSSGFGKRFVAAGDGQWGAAMQDDLVDAVDWAVAQGVAMRERVAIMGSSYGGYAALAGLAFTPDRFACGIDVGGPSDLAATRAAMAEDRVTYRAQLDRSLGDPATPAGRALLAERSPLNRADRIARPLLIVQGGRDARARPREAQSIVAAMTAHGVPVTYVVFPDEGHGFEHPANRLAFLAVAEGFLKRCLGGRAEPIADVLPASSAEVRAGVDYPDGLRAALAPESATSSGVATSASTAARTHTTCAVIQVADGGDASPNQARASATSAAMPACSASSDP